MEDGEKAGLPFPVPTTGQVQFYSLLLPALIVNNNHRQILRNSTQHSRADGPPKEGASKLSQKIPRDVISWLDDSESSNNQ